MGYTLAESTYGSDEIEAMKMVLDSGNLTMMSSDIVKEFESELAKYLKVPYALMVNSGSSANLLALAAITNPLRSEYIKPGAEILVPAVCWSTSVYPIIQMGCVPIFVDTDPATLNIDLESLKSNITNNTRAIMAVHVLGNACDMIKLMKIADQFNLIVIEDTCESLGSICNYNGTPKYLGTMGTFGTYSFYYSHHMTTGEGGAIVCHNVDDYNLLISLRSHGWTRGLSFAESTRDTRGLSFAESTIENEDDIDPRFTFINLGYNLRPMAIQGAMGLIQLKKLDQMNEIRIENYRRLKEMVPNNIEEGANMEKVVWFGFPMIRDIDKKHLSEMDIEYRPIISGNFLRQPVVKNLPHLFMYNINDFPGADVIHYHGTFIGLSCKQLLTQEQLEFLVDALTHTSLKK